jgi:amino acid permease
MESSQHATGSSNTLESIRSDSKPNNTANASHGYTKSIRSDSSRSTIYEERIIVETLDQGIYGFTPGVKNELGQEVSELLQRHLKARHVIMISLGGVVGTGLFLGEWLLFSGK